MLFLRYECLLTKGNILRQQIDLMNIFLTGATGFVGQHFLKFCAAENTSDRIFALSRNKSNPEYKNVTWLEESKNYDKFLKDHLIDIIIHLAGKAHDTKNTSVPEEYTEVNYEMTVKLYDAFAKSAASKFIFLSTIKAVGDDKTYITDSNDLSDPQTPYAKSKRDAEKYIQSYNLPANKQHYILRPVLIYGSGVKGNLATLVKFAKMGLPYPFEAFENKRSYLSVNNLNFILAKVFKGDYSSFTLNIANEDAISTKELISLIYKALNEKPSKINFPETVIKLISLIGDLIPIPLNTEKLKKITSSFVVDTGEMTKVLGFNLPEKTRDTISLITKN